MKDKFIRSVPPLSLAVIGVFFGASVLLCIVAIISVIKNFNLYTLLFLVIMVVDLVCALGATKNMMKNGVRFCDDRVEFTTVDTNNIYYYADIEKAEGYKDDSASLKKRYTDRYTSIILHLKNGEIAIVELGSTTKKKLAEIKSELDKRIKGE